MPDSENTDTEVHHVSKGEPEKSVTVPKRTFRFNLRQPPIAAIGVVVVVAALWLSFSAGRHYQREHQPMMTPAGATTTPFGTGMPGFNGRGGRMNRLGNVGQVTAISSSSITIDNSRTSASQTFSIVSGTQVINQGAIGSVSDIKTGQTVIVETLTSNTGQASRITINPTQTQPPQTQPL